MSVAPPQRPGLSPVARALRLQRIFARLQEGASYAAIAAEEGVSRERLRQIVKRAVERGGLADRPDHARMQIARLAPALRLAAAAVAEGEIKAIPLLMQVVDRLDRYCDPDRSFRSPHVGDLIVAPDADEPPPRAPRRGGEAALAGQSPDEALDET